ncbi:hypothetical protein AB0I72_19455 [Nocardiopsis sp. NPDC049922]|uniref:hypothetical protein n=1 Tax=Nocardiopsis sp. NPDC049922 TaxID=3155157 RepID=UPI0033EF2683
MRTIQDLVATAETAIAVRAARVRRRILHTAVIEDMPGHPEHIRDLVSDDQDAFDDIIFEFVAEADPCARTVFALSQKAGW